MADKIAFFKLFNTKADEFCKDLVATFPDVNEFKQLKSGLLLVKNLDEKKPREYFHNYIGANFRQHILDRDESFFLHDVQNPVSCGLDASTWHRVLTLLRSLWETLNKENKESIWKYFQVLIAISDKI